LDFGLTRSPELQSFLSKDLVVAIRLMIWMLAVLAIAIGTIRQQGAHPRYFQVTTLAWLAVGAMAIGLALLEHAQRSEPDLVQRVRNFYGVLSVFDHRPDDEQNQYRVLLHGRITHGLQFANPRFASWPTTYYTRSSGVGRAIDSLPETPRRVGLVGLGVGTLAAYGRAGDNFRIYEINPQVVQLAQKRFTYLSNCPARIDLILGDARLSLERAPPCQFDLLALDAFSSDSIPVHLLTREALQLYQRHLKPSGILAVHISNHFLNLEPVVAALAHDAHLHSVLIDTDGEDEEWWDYGSTWVLLSRDEGMLRPIQEAGIPPHALSAPGPLWTDDFTSLYQILKSPK
jgi:SAM-dependent methyltransferase